MMTCAAAARRGHTELPFFKCRLSSHLLNSLSAMRGKKLKIQGLTCIRTANEVNEERGTRVLELLE